MDSGKQSGLSSQEKNHRKQEKSMEEEDETGVGRTYECAFCKHGFTNAQALGGHMNIHRKDKAKAKQKNREQPLSKVRSRNEILSNLMQNPLQLVPQLDQNEKHQLNYYMSEGRQVKYKVYLPPSNPNFQSGNFRANLQTLRPERCIDGYDHGNLSLEIGSRTYVKGINDDGNAKENEVDLELRLGPDPTRYGDY